MKRIFKILLVTLILSQTTNAQLTNCLPCDQLGMVMNVGSQETAISIYHSGQYLTHPQSENIFIWEFSDQQGNLLHKDTLVNASTISFGHSWSLTDTIDVMVSFVNDFATLPDGSSINCLFEDQIYWVTDQPTPWGSWTFIYNNPGVDINTPTDIDKISPNIKQLIKIVDLLGREYKDSKSQLFLYIYDDGTVEKKIIVE